MCQGGKSLNNYSRSSFHRGLIGVTSDSKITNTLFGSRLVLWITFHGCWISLAGKTTFQSMHCISSRNITKLELLLFLTFIPVFTISCSLPLSDVPLDMKSLFSQQHFRGQKQLNTRPDPHGRLRCGRPLLRAGGAALLVNSKTAIDFNL